jgi:hypothetical protein
MAKTAVTQLQDQIEAIRREAFAAGFEAAMQAVRHFASSQRPSMGPQLVEPARRRAAQRSHSAGSLQQRPDIPDAPRRRAAIAVRPQRGTNARLIEEVLQSNAPRALRPTEIRSAIQREKGVAIAFTSIRHALGQLEARRVAEQVRDSNAWRYREGADTNFSEVGGDPITVSVE